jgi:membrane-bound lytic murein transglycosylase B
MRALFRLTPPSRRARLRTGPPLPAGRLLAFYRREQRRYGVGWHVLAAVNLVESAFGRLRNDSVAGAQGPMQFIPSTWAAYGLGGDVHDPADAIRGAANYLSASGAPRNYARALFAYNRSPLYVRAVLAYARTMARRPRAFFELYSWQAYMRTADGEVRLTGPGRRY